MPKTLSVFPRIALTLAACGMVLPIAGPYLMGFLLMVWQAFWARTGPKDDPLRAVVRPLHVGVLALIGSQLVSALLGWAFSPYGQPFRAVMKVSEHMAVKWGALWFVLYFAMVAARRRGWLPRRVGGWLLVWMVLNFAYCVAQRYLGLDWTHGWDARLGQHRFAYDVYRISGFMGHPLSLAYNLMLLSLLSLALVKTTAGGPVSAGKRGLLALLDTVGERRGVWAGVGLLAFAILVISGSRFVLLVVPATVILCEGGRLLRYWRWLVPAALLFGAALWLEGSVLGRFGELFDPAIPIADRLPRLVYWQVHWRMFLGHPVWGVTLAGLDEAMKVYYAGVLPPEKAMTAHNMFLQALADSGLIGLAGVLALLTGMTMTTVRARRLTGKGTGLGYLTLATVLSGLAQNNLRDSEYVFALWLAVSLLLQSLEVPEASRTVAGDGANTGRAPVL